MYAAMCSSALTKNAIAPIRKPLTVIYLTKHKCAYIRYTRYPLYIYVCIYISKQGNMQYYIYIYPSKQRIICKSSHLIRRANIIKFMSLWWRRAKPKWAHEHCAPPPYQNFNHNNVNVNEVLRVNYIWCVCVVR